MAPLAILGAHGQVGRALAGRAAAAGVAHRALSRAQCDVTDPDAVRRAVAGAAFVANCAAYTAVDRAESEPAAAARVNAQAPAVIAAACAAAGAALVHISTDYVFDGESPNPAREDDPPRPLGAYGASKLAGEVAVRAALPRHVILRTSWVFSAHGQNFVRTMLRLARTRPRLDVVDDQVGGPTAAADIAGAILAIVAAGGRAGFSGWGTYHYSGAPAVSWCGFARAILADAGVAVAPIATADYPTPARRPKNSVLDCGKILRVFGIAQPDWRIALARVRAALAAEAP